MCEGCLFVLKLIVKEEDLFDLCDVEGRRKKAWKWERSGLYVLNWRLRMEQLVSERACLFSTSLGRLRESP